jgi:hypothetical protein
MSFSFSKALSSIVDFGTDIVLGKETSVYDTGTNKTITSRGGGFLDTAIGLVGKGAKAYREMQDDEDGNVFESVQYDAPDIRRVGTGGGRAGSGGLTGPATRWTPRNQIVNDALLRRLKNANFEATLEKMTASTTVRPTARRKAPVTPGKSEIRRTTAAPRISTQ